MNPVNFRKLSLTHQSSFLWKDGIHLCSRKTCLFLVHLYAIHNFYVEVYFSYELCRVERINVLESTRELDPFLLHLPMPGNMS